MEKEKFVELLNQELVIAMGCTEPAACALAGAKAKSLFDGTASMIDVLTSRDMVKNAMGVGIPNCKMKGVQAAVALGVALGDDSKGLEILSDVNEMQRALAASYTVNLHISEELPSLFVKVSLKDCRHDAVAVISGSHSHFSYLEQDGKILLDEPLGNTCSPTGDTAFMASVVLADIIGFACTMPERTSSLLLQAAKTNLSLARHALKGEYGLSVGKVTYAGQKEPPRSLDDAFCLAASLAAAASDARMAGCPLPVVINSGSGNQGITITVPIAVVARYLGKDDDELAKALCISELVGLSLTARKDRLSALCGAFTASIGTACGLVYLLGGDRACMDRAVNVMVGDLTGIICDGAKMTCALKIYSCVQSAILACKLAFSGHAPDEESGIVGMDSIQSFDYLSRISHEGMEQTDRTILSIMLEKQKDGRK
jgi:L-cysteine desulfidase